MWLELRLFFLLGCLVSQPAQAAGLELRCEGPTPGHLGATSVCTALKSIIGGKNLSLRLTLTKDEGNLLAGRLSWAEGGRQIQGPLIEVSSSDRPLDQRAATRLARGLVDTSDLP